MTSISSGPPGITVTGVTGDTVTLQPRTQAETASTCHQQPRRRKSSFALDEKIWELRVSKDRQKEIWLKQSSFKSKSSAVPIARPVKHCCSLVFL